MKIRQTKHKFGPEAEPFGVGLAFSEEEITGDEHALDATELAQEYTLNADDRVLMVLVDGPAYPANIVERTGNPLGTVKNALSSLHKDGLASIRVKLTRVPGPKRCV